MCYIVVSYSCSAIGARNNIISMTRLPVSLANIKILGYAIEFYFFVDDFLSPSRRAILLHINDCMVFYLTIKLFSESRIQVVHCKYCNNIAKHLQIFILFIYTL